MSEWILNGTSAQLVLYSAIHVGSCWKIPDRRQIKTPDNTQTKHNTEKANTAKQNYSCLVAFCDTRP